jgi:DNA-binding NtrC family response regulator
MKGTILIVEDDAELRRFLSQTLEEEGLETRSAATAEDALAVLEGERVDAILTDVHLGAGESGIALAERARTLYPEVPVMVLTAFGSMELAVEALRAGAADFLTKPIDLDLLLHATGRALEQRALRAEVRRLRAHIEKAKGPDALVGESAPIAAVKTLLERAARTDASLLICGESGTGKEVVARLLHERSRRSDGPFIAVNCSAFPEQLLESQLFGHKKGAFTDARSDHRGLLLEAEGGTLFLDEIGDMPPALQPKLLRVLQERRVRPVGGDREVPFDVRIISATHRDLEAEIEAGRFRDDLFWRLNVVQIDLPPLRVRGNDILTLAQHFLIVHAARHGVPVKSFSPAAARALTRYGWPGNVRELSNAVERAVALAEEDLVDVQDLPARVLRDAAGANAPLDALAPLEEVERAHILRVFELCKRNKVHTAEALGIDRKTLYRKLTRYGVG